MWNMRPLDTLDAWKNAKKTKTILCRWFGCFGMQTPRECFFNSRDFFDFSRNEAFWEERRINEDVLWRCKSEITKEFLIVTFPSFWNLSCKSTHSWSQFLSKFNSRCLNPKRNQRFNQFLRSSNKWRHFGEEQRNLRVWKHSQLAIKSRKFLVSKLLFLTLLSAFFCINVFRDSDFWHHLLIWCCSRLTQIFRTLKFPKKKKRQSKFCRFSPFTALSLLRKEWQKINLISVVENALHWTRFSQNALLLNRHVWKCFWRKTIRISVADIFLSLSVASTLYTRVLCVQCLAPKAHGKTWPHWISHFFSKMPSFLRETENRWTVGANVLFGEKIHGTNALCFGQDAQVVSFVDRFWNNAKI